MEYTSERQQGTLVIQLKGDFTYPDNRQFRDILNRLEEPELTCMTLDFSGVKFIDSAALGMLLLLREEAQLREISLELTGACGQIQKMFEIALFDVIFEKKERQAQA